MSKPAHLEPSKLGTKEYWDALYTTELANHEHDPSDTGTVWFDDSDAEAKLLAFLEDPGRRRELGLDTEMTSFLDLGTGNGALLFGLRDAGWNGPMLGVDYSPQSVLFARRIERLRRRKEAASRGDDVEGGEEEADQVRNETDDKVAEGAGEARKVGDNEEEAEEEEEEIDIHFAEHDILHGPASALLGAGFSPAVASRGGWDVVLDKGTFDAVSLSAETLDATANTANTNTSGPRRINEAYGSRVLALVREGGLFLITSCNWTETELRSWFEKGAVRESPSPASASATNEEEEQEVAHWGFEVVGRVEYRSFSFGGVKGQTISSLCFRKVRKTGHR
ncbi:hypothetical protein F5Y19DRAFT_131412 [Xylariaceae sp. FL1651]|nr:hypothetical protein F5Y19DRAFT_131412 [Xylariaceae sp. FL1651]